MSQTLSIPEMGACKNRIFVAAAGSGKTWLLVNEALLRPQSRILITTYTDTNTAEIEQRFIEIHGCVPPNVTISGWFSFLLEHGVRPYQGCVIEKRIVGLHFNQGVSGLYKAETSLSHYLDDHLQIYRDKVSKFACKCDHLTSGRVIRRMASVFDEIFIDEVQDMAGYDLDLIELLMDSRARILLVGDPRQGTYSTSDSPKYSKFKRAGIVKYFRQLESKRSDLAVDEVSLAQNRRCNQQLCDLSDALFPQFASSRSSNGQITGHDGVFLVRKGDVDSYIRLMRPTQLRHSRKKKVSGEAAVMNFGAAKGLTFERTLIYPTENFLNWLRDRDTELADDTRAKLYVALTRARFSAGIVVDTKRDIPGLPLWTG